MSGGRLGLRSRVGEGSTFWFELPLGIGKEAVMAISEGRQFTPAQEGLADVKDNTLDPEQGMVYPPSFHPPAQPPSIARSESALHHLMDQGLYPSEVKRILH
jgi:osomolarity two-component system, sensor histidine kinase SLN1